MNAAERRYDRLRRQHRCVRCTDKLGYDDIGNYTLCARCRAAKLSERVCSMCGDPMAPDATTKCCIVCRDRGKAYRRRAAGYKHRRENYAALLAKIAKTADDGVEAQAKALGVTKRRIYALRNAARMKGYEIDHGCYERASLARARADKLAALDTAKPCRRGCGLRGEHECLRGDAKARRAA